MADDTAKTQQGDAPVPDWLKNAQNLAQHEEAAVSAAKPAETTIAAVDPAVIPAQGQDTAVPPAGVADAPLPAWLTKAAEKAAQPAPVVLEPTVVSAPATVVEPSAPVAPVLEPALTPAPAPAPVATPPVSVEPVPVSGEPPKTEAKVDNALPGWLQNIQREQKVLKGEPASTPSNSSNDVSQIAPGQNPAADVVPAPLPVEQRIAETGKGVPAGMLETRVMTAEKTAVNGGEPSAVKPAVEEPKPKVDEAAKAAASQKTDMFKSAESAFLSFLGKSQASIKQGQTAGAPKEAVAESVNVTETEKQEVSAVSATGKVPEKTVSEKPLAKAPTGKAAEDKATAEERRLLVEGEKIYQQGLTTIRDLIAPSSMEISYDKIRIEGMFAQSFYVYTYPRYLDTNWLSPVINFDVTMDIAQFIYPIDSATIMRVLKKKVAQMQASVRINAEKGMVSDPALETALQDADELRTSIQRGQEKFFQFALYFTIYSEDEKKIEKISKQLESILGGKLILTKKTELQMEQGFNSCLPMCLDELEVSLNMNTSPLSSTFPFSSSDLTSNEGILYGLNRHNDSLIIFDRFSLENANSVVFAKSGAGKSYCVKLEILRSMMVGTDVIVIDPENEYEALAQTVGGAYLKVSLTSDRRINPFDLPSPMEGEEVQPGDLLRQNIISLHGLMKLMLGGVSPEEEGIMDKALNDVYSLKGITMDVVDPANIVPPTMEDLYDILSTMEGGMGLAQRLQKFTVGTYSGIFNKPTNVDLESGMMVFCIRDLEDALRPIAMYIILNYIWNRIRSKLKKRILVIDEAWTMMQHEDSARFLFGLVKRARKYYLGISTITQDVEDFVKSPFGKPVVTNSSMQLLLKQAPAAIEILTKVFNLTEGEKYMLLNSGVGQGLFFAGLKHVAIQIIASYTEDKIVTTNPEEILKGRESAVSYES